MGETLKEYLLNLHDCLSSDSLGKYNRSGNVAHDVIGFCLESIAVSELGIHCALLFDRDIGVTSFLNKSANLKEFESTKADLIKFLSAFYQQYANSVGDHLILIKDVCISLLNRDQSAKVKREAIGTLIEVLETRISNDSKSQLDVPNLSNKIFNLCLQSARASASVRSGYLQLLGILCEKFPQHMHDKSERLFAIYVAQLKKEMTSKQKKPELQIVAGCFKGLKGYLYNFAASGKEADKFSQTIYSYVMAAIDPNIQINRFEVPRAALGLFSAHCSYFKSFITNDHETVYKYLSHWVNCHNKDAKYSGMDAMEACFVEVTNCLVEWSMLKEENNKCVTILKYFLQEVIRNMCSPDVSKRWLLLSVKGFGIFSPACKELLPQSEVKRMFELMLRRSEDTYVSPSSMNEDNMNLIPDFLGALIHIFQCLEKVEESYILPLQRIVVILFECYPKLITASVFSTKRNFVHLLCSLSFNPALQKSFIQQIVHQGIIRTCSHETIIDEDKELDENTTTHKNYADLWTHLLNEKNYAIFESDAEKVSNVVRIVFDSLMKSILSLLRKLKVSQPGLAETEGTGNDVSAEDLSALSNDDQIFVNLIEFARFVINENTAYQFVSWIPLFTSDVIELSSKAPTVSGFYKLLEINAQMCKHLKYFEGFNDLSKEGSKKMVFFLLYKYLKEVVGRLKEFKDDLLASCLKFALALPLEIIQRSLPILIDPMKTALYLGGSHMSLAEVGFEALQEWTIKLPSDEVQDFLIVVLPCLDSYLSSSTTKNEGDELPDALETKSASKIFKSKTRVPLRFLKALQDGNTVSESPLMKLRIKIAHFLGSIGGHLNSSILRNAYQLNLSKAVTWDSTKHLAYAIPFQDMKPVIYFDQFLPRIVELALTSSDRQTKVVVCELLHSMVIFMLGKSVQLSSQFSRKVPMDKIYKHLFPALLRLGCDAEQVAVQLFHPLVMHLIHWLTNSTKFESPETMMLLDTILDNIASESSSSLRQFSAECAFEFLKWSLKQSSPEELSKSPGNPKSMLKRIYAMALHPNVYRRLGAAMAFNSIYRLFREEDSLVDQFCLEALIVFIKSLAMAHHDKYNIGTAQNCVTVISHLLRIIKQKSAILLKPSKRRRNPLGSGSDFCLLHVMPWVIHQCGCIETICHQECMKFVNELLPLQPGVSTAKEWLQKTMVSDGGEYLIQKRQPDMQDVVNVQYWFEGGGSNGKGILSEPVPILSETQYSLSMLCGWLEKLLAALDCYSWFFRKGLLNPSEVFAVSSSNIFKSISHFIIAILKENLESIINSFNQIDIFAISPSEREAFNRLRCTVLVRLMDFMVSTLQRNFWKNTKYSEKNLDERVRCALSTVKLVYNSQLLEKQNEFAEKIFCSCFYESILMCALEPSEIGFDMTEVLIIENLPAKVIAFIKAFLQGIYENHLQVFVARSKSILTSKKFNLLVCLPIEFSKSFTEMADYSGIQQIINGYKILHQAGILQQILGKKEFSDLKDVLFESVSAKLSKLFTEKRGNTNPQELIIVEKVLDLALNLSDGISSFCHLLFDDTCTFDKRCNVLSTSGGIFYNLFQTTCHIFLTEHIEAALPVIFRHANQMKTHICKILQGLCQSDIQTLAGKERISWKRSKIMKPLLSYLDEMLLWCDEKSSDEIGNYGISILKYFTSFDEIPASKVTVIVKMFTALLSSQRSLPAQLCILDVVPSLLGMVSSTDKEDIKSTLSQFMSKHFPLSSDHLTIGTKIYVSYMEQMQKFMKVMVLAEDEIMFTLMINVMTRETKSIFERKILPHLIAFVKRINIDKRLEILNSSFVIFKDADKFPMEQRKNCLHRICLNVLSYSGLTCVRKFFIKNILSMVKLLEQRLMKSPITDFHQNLLTKQGCFEFVAVLYSSVHLKEISSPSADIVNAYCPNAQTGKELTQALTKAAHSAKSEDTRGENMVEVEYHYHVSAFKALASIVACTQTDAKFYNALLFNENLVKGQLLLDNLVDKHLEIEFQTELKTPFQRSKQLQLIRNQSDDIHSTNHSNERQGRHGYLSTQYLMESSLSQDVQQFDFLSPVQSHSTYSEVVPTQDARRSTSAQDDEEDDIPMKEDELEMDIINQQPSMATFISLINHMHSKKVYTEPNTNECASPTMPQWMLALHKKFEDPGSIKNIKLFIAKIIANLPKVFEPCGQHWFGPLVKFITRTSVNGGPLNYYVLDVITTMLSWGPNIVPKDDVIGRNISSALLEYCVKHCHHSTRGVLKGNLQIIKTIVQVWKESVTIPYSLIYQHFSQKDINLKNNMTGLQLLGIIISAGFPPYHTSQGEPSEDEFYKALTNNIKFKYKEVYGAASEVSGLALKNLREVNEDIDKLLGLVVDQLQDLSNIAKDRFVTCLFHVHLNYPEIVERFLLKIVFIIPSMFGVLRSQCMQCIASRIIDMPDRHHELFVELKSKGLEDMIVHRDEDAQVAAIKVFHGLLRSLTPEQTLSVIPSIVKLKDSQSSACREVMFELFMWTYDNYKCDTETLSTDPAAQRLLEIAKEMLLFGIRDSNTSISLKVLNFWRHETRLPTSTIERLIEVLRALYSTETEREFLSYTTNLIYQLTSLSPDYNRPMYDNPLDASLHFQSCPIDFSWQHQRGAMTPLLAQTQLSSSQESQSEGFKPERGLLRATQQSLQFSMTQSSQDSTGESHNWMNPSVQVDQLEVKGRMTESSQTSLLFTKPLKRRQLGTLIKHNASSITKNIDETDSSQENAAKDKAAILRLSRRILKDEEGSRLYFAKQEARRKKLRSAVRERQKKSRGSKIVMYRTYRHGDFPDIQIKNSELIVPLQAVAQHDAVLAKHLFSSTFDAIFNELPSRLTDNVLDEAHKDIQSAFDTLIESTTLSYPPFIHAIQNACFSNKGLKLDSAVVCSSSILSVQQPIGILLIEKQIMDAAKEVPEPQAKRMKKSQSTQEDVISWIELSKLYQSIDEYDYVRSIFSGHVVKEEITKQALSAEAANDYGKAIGLYNEAVRSRQDECETSHEEQDYWDTARLRCYENLGQWEHLGLLTTQSLDEDSPADVSRMWEDPTLQDQYLQYYMKSNMKLICSGNLSKVHSDFDSFIESALNDKDKKMILQSRFIEDLALLSLFKGDIGQCSRYVDVGIQSFLEEWRGASSLLTWSRQARLGSLHKLTEIKECANLVANKDFCKDDVETILAKWENRLPKTSKKNVLFWDDIVMNRCGMMRKLKSRATNIDEHVYVVQEARNYLRVAQFACQQRNYSLSLEYLKNSLNSVAQSGSKEKDLSLEWSHIYSSVYLSKAKSSLSQATHIITKELITVVKQLDDRKDQATESTSSEIKHAILQGQTFLSLKDTLKRTEFSDLPTVLGDKSFLQLNSSVKNLPLDKQEVLSFLEKMSLTNLEKAAKLSDNLEETSSDRLCRNEALLTLAIYCDGFLREKGSQDTVDSNSKDCDHHATTLVRSLLRSMELQSKEAMQRFPRLLQLIESYPHTQKMFVEMSCKLPCWMFIGWINQMVVLIDSPLYKCVFPILESIANAYTQALPWSLRISKEQFMFNDFEGCKESKRRFEKLYNKVYLPTYELLTIALGQLTDPLHVYKDWIDMTSNCLSEEDVSADKIASLLKNLRYRLFQSSTRDIPEDGIQAGQLAVKFGKDISRGFKDMFKEDGSEIIKMSLRDFRRKANTIVQSLKDSRAKGNLKDYSPFLSTFQDGGSANLVEIPGQYIGGQKPMPDYHVKIANFDEKVLVMTSIRRPKRITIRGNDQKDYKFLIKGGEDLRLDFRIEQLFELMNGILMKDSTCHSLQLKTYTVIPMSSRIGMISWLDDTKPLKEVIQQSATDEEADCFIKARTKHTKFVEKYKDAKCLLNASYHGMYKKASRAVTEKEFKTTKSMIPWDLLRRSFMNMAISSEAYFILKCHFLKTYACLCICHYILGIGDRHMSNFLIDTTSGGVIGIDFGHAFGSATQFLGSPELMPFRLTKQIRNLLLPLKDLGPLYYPMVSVMKAMRENAEILTNTMDVFISEPLLEWEKYAKKFNNDKKSSQTSDKDSSKWYRKEKIDLCSKKLAGVNCAVLMCVDAKNRPGKENEEISSSLETIIYGEKSKDIRRKFLDEAKLVCDPINYYLSTEDQVTCLIDQAIDSNILGRTYAGWEPWV